MAGFSQNFQRGNNPTVLITEVVVSGGVVHLFFLLSLLVCLTVNGPLVLFGADDEVLGALLKVESVSAAAMRHEKPLLAHFNSTLQTWMVENGVIIQEIK